MIRRPKGGHLKVLVALVMCVAVTACSGESDAKKAADPEQVSQAEELLERATSGLIYSGELAPANADLSNAVPADFKSVTEWAGPTATVNPPRDRSVVMISCAAGTTCQTFVEEGKKVIEDLDLGWKVEIISADGSPQSFASSFESAIAKKPDAIVGVALADTAVAAQLEKAKDRGIFTTGVFVQPTGDTRYDSYLAGNTPALFALQAYGIIAHSEGSADVLVVHDGSYPNLDNNATQAEAILERCDGCTVRSADWTSEQAQNPVEAQQIISAALRANPDINYILLPYDSLGLPATVAAARAASGEVHVVVKDGFPSALKLVASGEVLFNAGFDNAWAVWVTADQIFRALADEDLIPEDAQGLPIQMLAKSNVPTDGVVDFSKIIDFRAKYKELWGLN